MEHPKTFIERMSELYKEALLKWPSKVRFEIFVAQAAVESGFGTSELAREANNYGGIKFKQPFEGEAYTVVSPEYIDGEYKKISSQFCKFKSIEEFVEYHVKFFTNLPWRSQYYAKVLEATTNEGQAAALTGTYANDPEYGRHLLKVIGDFKIQPLEVNKMKEFKMREWKEMLTSINLGGAMGKVEYLTAHFVGAAGQAESNGKYFQDAYREASAHIFIDPKVTILSVPLDRQAWHVGDGLGRYGIRNDNSIGVELCQDTSTGPNVWKWDFNAETRKESILVFAYLMQRFNVPISRVVRHYDASRKLCPGNWAERMPDGNYDWKKWRLWKKDLETYVTTGQLVDSQRGINYTTDEAYSPSNITAITSKSRLTDEVVAKQVIDGVWGNGDERRRRLEAEGYDYARIQSAVNSMFDKQEDKPKVNKAGSGLYRFTTQVNVRNKPVVTDETHTGYVYDEGDLVNIEYVLEPKDGIVWGSYLSANGGYRRYVALSRDGVDYTVKL